MKELKATRLAPGDRWTIIGDEEGERVYSSLTECLNAIFTQTGVTQFFMDARRGEVHTEDGVAKPEPIKKFSLYGEEM